ncbi:MAG: cobyrinic acid a,c-diamide synthase, partial [Actinomycetota bacterium]|nr:cobyrinic acid a,c-diamide synthase [Actinomycetota bacterium]
MLDDVRAAIGRGMVVWAECGGYMWLARTIDGHPAVGAVPGDARMTDSLTIGYRTAVTAVDTPLGPAGTELRGHEFHHSVMDPPGDALVLSGRYGGGPAGFGSPSILASYLHQHLASTPELAERFVAAAIAGR